VVGLYKNGVPMYSTGSDKAFHVSNFFVGPHRTHLLFPMASALRFIPEWLNGHYHPILLCIWWKFIYLWNENHIRISYVLPLEQESRMHL
jgi:hypothetical protein